MGLKECLSPRVGICEMDREGKVVAQDEVCKRACGDRIGKKCSDGCMSDVRLGQFESAFDQGVRLKKNVHREGGAFDTVTISDEAGIRTILIPKDEQIQNELEYIKRFGLTPAELEIIKRALSGQTNSEIAASLFVSPKTLRTHLNNIYKKIPESLKAKIMER